MPGLVDVPWGLSREARQRSRQTQEKPLEKSRLFKLACAKLCSGEPSSHAQRVAGAFDSHQECNCADSHPQAGGHWGAVRALG